MNHPEHMNELQEITLLEGLEKLQDPNTGELKIHGIRTACAENCRDRILQQDPTMQGMSIETVRQRLQQLGYTLLMPQQAAASPLNRHPMRAWRKWQ